MKVKFNKLGAATAYGFNFIPWKHPKWKHYWLVLAQSKCGFVTETRCCIAADELSALEKVIKAFKRTAPANDLVFGKANEERAHESTSA